MLHLHRYFHEVELAHLDQIQMTHRVKPLLTKLRELVKPGLGRIKSMIGTNSAAIEFLKSTAENVA